MEMDGRRTKAVFELLRHDINNHIYGATGYLELIREHAGSDEKLLRYLRSSELEMLASGNLVDNMSALMAMDREPFVAQDVLLRDLVEKAVKANERLCEGRSFEPQVQIASDAAVVRADKYLENALVQAVGNAIRADRSERIVLDISSSREGSSVRLCVEDQGPGMSDSMKKEAFGRFSRLMDRADYHGKGLGLSVVKAAVERCGGRVHLEDRTEGGPSNGLRVVMVLPA